MAWTAYLNMLPDSILDDDEASKIESKASRFDLT